MPAEPVAFEQRLERTRVVAIIRHARAEPVFGMLDAMAEGGIECIEITTSTPRWAELVSYARGLGLAAGAGTVLTLDHVRAAHDRGAEFTVSPGFDLAITAAVIERGMVPLPGVCTPTEVTAAMAAGATTLKLFPAQPLGASFLKALRAPFPDVRFVPTGGIGIGDIASWMAAGASAVALGSVLTADGEAAVRQRAAAAITAAAPRALPSE